MFNLLIIKPSSLGDIIHGLQVAQSIREYRPDAHITWVAREVFTPFVKACDAVDHVLTFQRKGGFSAFYNLVQQIRDSSYDWILDFQGLARSGLLTLFSRGRHKIGRADAREWSSLAYHRSVPLPQSGRDAHAVEILLQFMPELGLPSKLEGKLTFSKAPPSPNISQEILEQKNLILLFPNSRRPEKEWNGFVSLTDRLLQAFPDKTIAWAGQKPLEIDPSWKGKNFCNLIGKTQLLDLLPLIQSAQCVVANDSGPMHIAAAMGVNVIALFGPTPPCRYGPYPLDRDTHHIVQAPNDDLTALSVDTVFNAVQNGVVGKEG